MSVKHKDGVVGASLLSLPTALKRLFTPLTTKAGSREACSRPSISDALVLPVLPGQGAGMSLF